MTNFNGGSAIVTGGIGSPVRASRELTGAVIGRALGAYTAIERRLRGLTTTAAPGFGQANARVYSVHPRLNRSAITTGMAESKVAAEPVTLFGEPEQVAAMVRFLVFGAGFGTGAELVVDRGAGVVQIPAAADGK